MTEKGGIKTKTGSVGRHDKGRNILANENKVRAASGREGGKGFNGVVKIS